MGSDRSFITIWIMFCVLNVQASSQTNSLNSFLYDYAFSAMHRPRTGRLYEVIPPINLTGVEVSIIRLRAHSLWRKGANLGAVEIPATTLPSPFAKRVYIVYQNLGNWSSSYYNVPNYTLVTPVIGFLAYDSTLSTINHRQLVELNARGANPMIVRFQNVPEDARMKCVRFSSDGSLEFSNVVGRVSCETRNQGHFSIVVPRKNRGNRVLMPLMVGIPAGIVVLVLGIVGFMLFKWRRVGKMVKESEKSEALDTIWVGSSRMPAASGIRTQPILESSYVL